MWARGPGTGGGVVGVVDWQEWRPPGERLPRPRTGRRLAKTNCADKHYPQIAAGHNTAGLRTPVGLKFSGAFWVAPCPAARDGNPRLNE